jgi:hypothetical protein
MNRESARAEREERREREGERERERERETERERPIQSHFIALQSGVR